MPFAIKSRCKRSFLNNNENPVCLGQFGRIDSKEKGVFDFEEGALHHTIANYAYK